MANQAFSYSSLARCLYSKDFYDDSNLSNELYREKVINDALDISANLFCKNIAIDTVMLGSKKGYIVSSLAEKLVLRRCVENIKSQKIFFLKQRDVIGKELTTYLKEGTPYRIYRLDIKSFFESIDLKDIKSCLESVSTVSTHTKKIIISYLDRFHANSNNGIPRGIEISPALSELLLQSFDSEVKKHADVFYYSRFVDDIIVITSSDECENTFIRWVRSKLPKSLHLNNNKKYIKKVQRRKRSLNEEGGTEVAKFDYLGYEYTIVDTQLSEENKNEFLSVFREVRIDLSKSKIRNFQTKISESFYNFSKNNDYNILYDRLFFLISNRDLKDKNSKKSIPTGVYYNYSLISGNMKGLTKIDNHLKFSIQSSRSRLGRKTAHSLTKEQRNMLLKLSFVSGFQKRIFKKYSPDRLKQITKIW